MPTIVFKLGGSLLDLPDLSARILAVLEQRPQSRPLILVGGGAVADVVRQWDALHELGAEAAHWLALRAMTLSAHLLSELLAGAKIVANREEAETVWEQGEYPVLNAFDFLKQEEPALKQEEPAAEEPLPHSWNVSSDSIAAWVAFRWPTDELVLLKSVDAPSPHGSPDHREIAPVDSHFQRLSPRLRRISWCNLRGPEAKITAYRTG